MEVSGSGDDQHPLLHGQVGNAADGRNPSDRTKCPPLRPMAQRQPQTMHDEKGEGEMMARSTLREAT